jgi:hypothetical protein
MGHALFSVAIVAACLACSFWLATLGEPQSEWLWCTMGKLC